MEVADIKNKTVRRAVLVILTPVAFVVYMAFGAAMYVTHCLDDIASAWKGASR